MQTESNPVNERIGRKRPRAVANSNVIQLDGRTREAKRIAELVATISGGVTMTPTQAAMVMRAAELQMVAETHRARAIVDIAADLDGLVRIERVAQQALRAALSALPRKSDTGQGLNAYLAQKATGEAA